jgi:hypothetical protein
MLRLPIKYAALGTLLMALIASPGLSQAFAMGGGAGAGAGAGGGAGSGGGGRTGYGSAGGPFAVPYSSQNRLGTNVLQSQKSHKTRRQNSF